MPVNVPKTVDTSSAARHAHLNSRMPVERRITHKDDASDQRQKRSGITHATAMRIMLTAGAKKATHEAFDEVSDECDRFLQYISTRIVAYMEGSNRKSVRECDIKKLASWCNMPLYS